MKQIYILVIVAFYAFNLGAQNTSVKIISKKTDSVLNGTEYIIYGDASKSVIKEEFYSVMEQQDSMMVGIKRTELSIISGTFEYFCWYLCYPPRAAGSTPTWKPVDSVMMYKNDTVNNLSVYLEPKGNLGKACYTYVFYPEQNPNDSSYLDICFDIVTIGVNENVAGQIEMYPNPTSDLLNVDLQTSEYNSALLRVVNVNGKVMSEHKINKGINKIDAAKLESGIYIIQILSEDEKLLRQEKVVIN